MALEWDLFVLHFVPSNVLNTASVERVARSPQKKMTSNQRLRASNIDNTTILELMPVSYQPQPHGQSHQRQSFEDEECGGARGLCPQAVQLRERILRPARWDCEDSIGISTWMSMWLASHVVANLVWPESKNFYIRLAWVGATTPGTLDFSSVSVPKCLFTVMSWRLSPCPRREHRASDFLVFVVNASRHAFPHHQPSIKHAPGPSNTALQGIVSQTNISLELSILNLSSSFASLQFNSSSINALLPRAIGSTSLLSARVSSSKKPSSVAANMSSQRFCNSPPISRCSQFSSPLGLQRGSNDIKDGRPYVLSRACFHDITKSITTGTHSEWEKTVIDTMALDDDHYYIEYEAYAENDEQKLEEGVDGMELDKDADMERIKGKLQIIYITVPRPAVLSFFRPVSLSKKLGAAHIASTTTLDIIMEEEDEYIDEDMNPMQTSKSSAMDMGTKDETTMDIVAEDGTPVGEETVTEKDRSTDAEMDTAHAATTLLLPDLAQVHKPTSLEFAQAQTPPSSSSIFEMYHNMKLQLDIHAICGLAKASRPPSSSSIFQTYNCMKQQINMYAKSGVANHSIFFPDKSNRVAKRTREMFEEDEDDHGDIGTATKRMRLQKGEMG
ncbi:hypothetical protein HDK90DRAFT_547569 [Phyllosticta capitalensis]|uniref:Uncharacterized protein n=1 Tax=Phyllosticta capitalensis TaxID=121624 RepID=A0ABR1Z123_9PEZI